MEGNFFDFLKKYCRIMKDFLNKYRIILKHGGKNAKSSTGRGN